MLTLTRPLTHPGIGYKHATFHAVLAFRDDSCTASTTTAMLERLTPEIVGVSVRASPLSIISTCLWKTISHVRFETREKRRNVGDKVKLTWEQHTGVILWKSDAAYHLGVLLLPSAHLLGLCQHHSRWRNAESNPFAATRW